VWRPNLVGRHTYAATTMCGGLTAMRSILRTHCVPPSCRPRARTTFGGHFVAFSPFGRRCGGRSWAILAPFGAIMDQVCGELLPLATTLRVEFATILVPYGPYGANMDPRSHVPTFLIDPLGQSRTRNMTSNYLVNCPLGNCPSNYSAAARTSGGAATFGVAPPRAAGGTCR
jgi:hypothetical protein